MLPLSTYARVPRNLRATCVGEGKTDVGSVLPTLQIYGNQMVSKRSVERLYSRENEHRFLRHFVRKPQPRSPTGKCTTSPADIQL